MAGTYIDGCTPDAGKDFVANGMSAFVRIRPISAPSGLNSSPQFVDQDTILFVAKDSLFSNQISAIDPDGDSLAYHFSRPYTFNLNWICGLSGPSRQAPASRWTRTQDGSRPLFTTPEGTWSVTITNKFGCQLTDSVHVKYYTGPDIYLPNAFSPNGDGRNDRLRPVVVGIASAFEFRVFNRGGQLLFQTKRPDQGWDGMIGQRPAWPGTYVWEASGIDYHGKLILRKGTVQLIP